ncbi:MAG: ATP-binding protein [Candidatus Sericytochromatia bacterium]
MLGAAAIAPAMLDALAGLSAGNPFYLEILLQHLVDQGVLQRRGGAWLATAPLDAERLPKGLRGLLEDKVGRLSPDATTVARVAAVVGYAFDLELLQAGTGLPDEALFAALAELDRAQIFTEREPGLYAFSQDQVQDVLYGGLTNEDRLRLHTAVSGVLEARLADRPLAEAPIEALTALADQAMRGTRRALTVAVCLAAGARHAALMDHQAAIGYLEAGLAAERVLHGPAETGERLSYLLLIGDVRRMTGQFAPALAAYEEALPAAEAEAAPGRLAGLLTSLAKLHQVQGRYDQALAACERARALAEGAGDSQEAARSLLTSARVHYFLGQVEQAVAHAEAALGAARSAEDAGKTGMALGFLGYLYATAVPSRIDEGVAMLHEAVALASALADRIGLNSALDFLGNAEIMLGDGRAATATFARKLALCREIGYREEEAFTRVNLAAAALELGAFREAAAQAAEAATLAEALKSRFPLAMALALEGACRLPLGEPEMGLARAEAAIALAEETNNQVLKIQARLLQAELLTGIGLMDEAAEAATRLAALLEGADNAEAERRLLTIEAELRLGRGEAAEALALARQAFAAAMAVSARGLAAQARHVAARAAIALGDWAVAREEAEGAEAIAGPLGQDGRLAIASGLRGEIALAEGRPEEARACFERMASLSRACEAPIWAAVASFGLAASAPYGDEARGLAAEAKAELGAVAARLDARAREAFLAAPERRRVIEGNYIGFGLPVAERRPRPMGWGRF